MSDRYATMRAAVKRTGEALKTRSKTRNSDFGWSPGHPSINSDAQLGKAASFHPQGLKADYIIKDVQPSNVVATDGR